MMIIYNQTFLHHIPKNIANKDRDDLKHIIEFSANPTDTRNQQSIHMPNPTNTQSFQPIQPQNTMTMHSHQPTQKQIEIPLPY